MLPKFPLHYCLCICLLTCASLHVAPSAASTEYNRYLAHIFNKYGSGGTMSFEGLEHLMYSLGLGQLEFEPTHTIDEHRPEGYKKGNLENDKLLKSYMEQQTIQLLTDESDVQVTSMKQEAFKTTPSKPESALDDVSFEHLKTGKNVELEFKEMHDPKHRHPRENDATFDLPPLTANVCLSPKSLLRLVIDHDDLHKRKLYKTVTNVDADDADTAFHNKEEEYNRFVNDVKLTPVAFMKLCPALLAQIDQQVCVRSLPLTHGEDPKETMWNAWLYASCSIFILSACGLLGILLVPLMKTIAYQEILNFLVAVAVGTLSGDALMHLLPHALVSEHEHEHGHEHEHHEEVKQPLMGAAAAPKKHEHDTGPIWICACAFFTACLMYILENLLPLLKGKDAPEHAHSHGHSHGHSHSHSHSHSHAHSNGHSHGHSHAHNNDQRHDPKNDQKYDNSHGHEFVGRYHRRSEGSSPHHECNQAHENNNARSPTYVQELAHALEQNQARNHKKREPAQALDVAALALSKPATPTAIEIAAARNPNAPNNMESREINVMLDEQKQDKKTGSRPLTPVAFMVVVGDGLHNLTDGLAIGAAFATDPVTGMATAFAVLCHELPHELGDFALLLQTGVSLRRAVYLNIVSSVLSFIGMAIGLLIAGAHGDMTRWIYAGTAGSFLYIAFADLVPAMSMEGQRNIKRTLIQVLGLLLGGVIMILIALNEADLEELFK